MGFAGGCEVGEFWLFLPRGIMRRGLFLPVVGGGGRRGGGEEGAGGGEEADVARSGALSKGRVRDEHAVAL